MSEFIEPLLLDSTGQKIIEAISSLNSRVDGIDDNEVTKFNTYSAQKIEQMFENVSDEAEIEQLQTNIETLQTDVGTIQTDVDSLKTTADTLTSNLETTDENVTKNASDIEDLSKSSHSHENLSILDNFTQSVIDNSHTHENKDVLDALGKSEDGTLLFNGEKIKSGDTGVAIDDKNASGETTYSSTKIESLVTDVPEITELKEKAHTHDNKDTLNKITESDDGNLLFDGKEIKSDISAVINNTTASDTTTYSSTKIDEKLSAISEAVSGTLKRAIVEALPQSDISSDTIYMVLKETGAENNIYDEYMYINSKWKLIGSTSVDLSDYYTKEEVTAIQDTLTSKITTNETSISSLSEKSHSHENKEILDNVTQEIIDNSHTHNNKDVLDKFSENESGALLFNGKKLGIDLEIPPRNPTNVFVRGEDSTLKVYWKDPVNTFIEDIKLGNWGGTILVINDDHPPVDENDGTIVINNTTRNAYSEEPYIIEGLENFKTYYLYFIPYTESGTYGYNDENRYTGMPANVFLDDVADVTAELTGETIKITWTNPEQTKTVENVTATWVKTTVVIKADNYPIGETDGIAYESASYEEGKCEFEIENGYDYYIRFFIESDIGSIKQTDIKDCIVTYAALTVTTNEPTLIGEEVLVSWTDENLVKQTLTQTFDANKKIIFKIPYIGTVTVYSTDDDTDVTNNVEIEAWDNYDVDLILPVNLVPFSTGTNAQITKMINAYYNDRITLTDVKSVWSVGDSRVIDIEATTRYYTHVAQSQRFVILDFDHDTLTTKQGTKTKALITIQQLRVMSDGETAELRYFQSASFDVYWETNDVRTWCNDAYYNALPAYVKSLTKQVAKKTCKTYNSTTLTTTNDYCFILSEREVLGSSTSNSNGSEGTQYSYYATSANRIKYAGNVSVTGSKSTWWLRSHWTTSAAGCYVYITLSGLSNYGQGNNVNGIAPCICF